MDTTSVRSYRNIYLTVFIANLPFFSVGHAAGWSSPSLPIITSEDFHLKISPDQASWITSMMPLGGFFGPLISGPLLDIVGRKWTITGIMVVVLMSWIVMACAWTVEMLYIGRFLCGFFSAVSFTTVPMYIAEISEPNMRGLLNNLALITRCLTILFQYSVGPFVSYLTLIQISCVVPVLYFILMPWMPESPYFLIAKGRKEDAEKSLVWLRGEMPPMVLKKEISDIQAYIDKASSQKGSYKDLFDKRHRRIVLIIVGLLSISQLVGSPIVLFYLQPILEASGSTLSASMSAISVAAAMTCMSFFVPFVAKRFGYKIPMLRSSIGLGVCMIVLGAYFFLKFNGIYFTGLDYVPIASLMVFIVISLGILNLPWAVAGEILPSSIKAQASAISGSISFFTGFLSTVTFPYIANTFGMDFAFWLYACFCFSTTAYVYVFVPETKGLTLNEIQDVIELPPKMNEEQNGQEKSHLESVNIVYLKHHYEINAGVDGIYKSINKT